MAYNGINASFRGNLGSDPEYKVLDSGAKVCNVSAAVTPRVKKGDEWVDGDTTWVRLTGWNYQADKMATLKKGDNVLIEGVLTLETYAKKDGSGDASALNVRVDEVFLGVRAGGGDKPAASAPASAPASEEDVAFF